MSDQTQTDSPSVPEETDAAPPSLRAPKSDEPFIVGVGASADGLEALKRFFRALPDEPGMIFMVAQHLAPDQSSDLARILQKSTDMEVQEAADNTRIRPDHVYVLPPGHQLAIDDHELRLRDIPRLESGRNTIDFLFRSLAEHRGERAVGVLLSGAGTDGTTGLRLIKEHGGVTLAQSPDEAGFEAMPRSAINADVVDFVMAAADLADRVAQLPRQRRSLGPLSAPRELSHEKREWLEGVIAKLRDHTGTDLSKYKRPTVLRRIGRRMQVRDVETIEDYDQILENDTDEIEALFDELLIGVTSFFRDAETWEELREEIVPELFAGRDAGDEIRVWVPGCATGEEAYTVALLLTEYADDLGEAPDIKIFATDIDRRAIETARKGRYPAAIASDVPADLMSRYFRAADEQYEVVKSVRRKVMFAPQNVLTDPPFSNLDVISCRNLLIYLESDAQKRLLEILHYALRPEGYLVLGESETPSQQPDMFEDVDTDHHIYRAASDGSAETVHPRPAFGFDTTSLEPEELDHTEPELDVEHLHKETLLARYAPPSVLVDSDYHLRHVVGDVHPYLAVRPGTATGEILEMLSDPLRPHVRTMLFEAFRSDDEPVCRDIEVDGDPLELQANPLESDLVELTFHPLPDDRETGREQTDPEQQRIIDQLEQELEETRNRLQSTIEEYESTNEKLRASNEELMSMNEELQSTTEELQTSKEELQSMNEEMTTVNEELNDKIEKLDAANADLRNLMRATDIGTIFLDRDLRINRFTDPVTEYVNVIASDEGRPFQHVTHSLATDALVDDAREAMETPTTVEREVPTENGDRDFLVRTMPYLDVEDRIQGAVLTFVDITDRKQIERRLSRREKLFRSVFEQAADAMFVYPFEEGRPGSFIEVNATAVDHVGLSREELKTKTIGDVLGGPAFDLEGHLAALRETDEASDEALLHRFGDEDDMPVDIRARRIDINGEALVAELVRDTTDPKRYREALVDSQRAEELADLRAMFLSSLSHDVRSPLSAILTTLGLLRRQGDDESRDQIDRIERSTQQLRKLLDSILRMARLDVDDTLADPEEIELVDQIEEITDLHEPLADQKGLDFRVESPEPPVEAELDSRFLAQILDNLIDNAVEHTDDGEVTVRLEATDEHVRLRVEDTGPGIPEEMRDGIFERAQTGERTSEETHDVGLGLAIVKQLTEAMGGDVGVESTVGEGSTFTVELPYSSPIGEDRDS